jgi:alpha-galactosidase
LYGKKGPSGDLGGTGCTDVEYRSQMSLWCMLNSPLTASNDIRSMNAETKRILLNKEMIAINQDALGQAGVLQINNETWTVILKPLSDGDYALAILNRSDAAKQADFSMAQFGLKGKYEMRDVWQYKTVGKGTKWKGSVQGHETKVMRLKKVG